jgi:DNA-directed RNA polymerase
MVGVIAPDTSGYDNLDIFSIIAHDPYITTIRDFDHLKRLTRDAFVKLHTDRLANTGSMAPAQTSST